MQFHWMKSNDNIIASEGMASRSVASCCYYISPVLDVLVRTWARNATNIWELCIPADIYLQRKIQVHKQVKGG